MNTGCQSPKRGQSSILLAKGLKGISTCTGATEKMKLRGALAKAPICFFTKSVEKVGLYREKLA